MTHRLKDEHAVVGAQQLRQQQLEELLLQAAGVNARLPDEVHPQRLEQVPWPLPCDLVQRILDDTGLTGDVACLQQVSPQCCRQRDG